jgi:uncharacterized membrane protein YbhN (UPF0104 family)
VSGAAPEVGKERFGWRDIVRIWSSAADGRRLRKPSDVLLLATSLLLLVLLDFVAPGPTELDTAIARLLDAMPSVAGLLWGVSYTALTVWALVLLLLPLASRHRKRLTADFLLAGVLAVAGSLLAGSAAGTDLSAVWASLGAVPDQPVYVSARVAVATAIIVAASPHLSRPLRYWGRLVVLLGAVGAVGLGMAWPVGALAAAIVGYGAAAIAHLLLGSPQGLLTAQQVEIALADVGVDSVGVADQDDEIPGEVLWSARRADGPDILVKVYGRDAWDTQVLGSLWTALTRRGEIPRLGRSRQSRVEHEALAMLVAERAGVPTLELVAGGVTEQGDALIVTGQPVRTLVDAASDLVSDEHLDGFWRALVSLHSTRMAHGRIDARHLVIRTDGAPALADFADAEFHADEGDRLVDNARLLVVTSLVVGTDRALDSAIRVIGADGMVALLPYLQPAALGRVTRQDVKAAEWDLGDLQKSAVARLGVEAPPLQQLRRVTLKSVVIVALIAIMAYAIIGAFAGVDVQSVVDALSSASIPLVLLALALSPTIQLAFAFSTLGSTMVRLAYVPVLMLQYAIQFIALCLPSTAARLALEIRFFQRFGVAPTPAVTMGMIDSFSGFVVQIMLIALILLSDLPGFTTQVFGSSSSSTSTDDSGPSLLVLVAVFAVGALIVTLIVPRLRHRLLGNIPRIRRHVAEQRVKAGDALLVLRNPRKVTTMLLGNLGAQVIQAVVLGVCLAAFGETAALSQLILINTAVSLFAGLMPVPGGMGVAEAGYTAGLQAIGIPAPIAVSTAITFRLVTFYLPPIWGSVAMRWLRRHEYV